MGTVSEEKGEDLPQILSLFRCLAVDGIQQALQTAGLSYSKFFNPSNLASSFAKRSFKDCTS
jgi:hypothetical protein